MSLLKKEWVGRLKRVTGVDRAIAYTVLARGLQIIGSTGTVLLIVRFMTPVEQGYYYTLLSLVALQIIFELGFSFVILQLAAHECVHLRFSSDGLIEGDPIAQQRLASIFQTALRWYSIAAVAMFVILSPLGELFLPRHKETGSIVYWQGPWIAAVLGTSLSLVLTPLLSFFEGCGEIRQIAAVRLRQSIAVALLSWLAVGSGHGLYASGAVNLGFVAVGAHYLFSKRRLLRLLISETKTLNSLRWREEVWPFQWKIALSWLGTYLTVQVLTPITFLNRGPIEAGRLGMSLSIAGYTWNIVFPWISTKASTFGALIAKRRVEELDILFFETLRKSLFAFGVLAIVFMTGAFLVHRYIPTIADRIVGPRVFGLLLLAAGSTLVTQSQAIYLRAHKREPFLVLSIVIAAFTGVAALSTVYLYGVTGLAISYFLCTGVIGPTFSTSVFCNWRKKYYQFDPKVKAQFGEFLHGGEFE